MTLGTPIVTTPGDAGMLVPEWIKFQAQNSQVIARALDFPAVSVTVTTTTSDTGEILDLTTTLSALGISFDLGFYYPITLRHHFQTENDRYFQELDYMIIGSSTAGTDPIIIGDGTMTTGVQGKLGRAFGVLAGAARTYGRVHYRGVLDAETTDGTCSQGITLGAGTAGVYALTFPLNRTARVNGVHVEQETPAAAEAGYGVVLDVAAAGTADFNVVQQDDGTVATNATAGTTFDIDLEVFPPANAFLVMDGTPDPGHIDLHILGIASDECLHRVDVYLGRPIPAPFQGS
jgi:hypothetical protein